MKFWDLAKIANRNLFRSKLGVITNIFLARAFFESFEGYSLFVFTLRSILFVVALVCAIAFLPAFCRHFEQVGLIRLKLCVMSK